MSVVVSPEKPAKIARKVLSKSGLIVCERACRVAVDCHLVAGDFDDFLKIHVSDMADVNRLHSARPIALPGVRQTRTFVVMKEVVDNAPRDI